VASHPGQIPAGGKGKISVVVDTVNRGGQLLTKRFRVYTNDPRERQTVLAVSGQVNAYIMVSPARVRLVGRLGETLSQQVRIVPQGYPFAIREAKASNGADISISIEPAGQQPAGQGYVLTVTSTRREAGSFGDYILIQTDLNEKPTIGIPVSGRLYAKQPPEK